MIQKLIGYIHAFNDSEILSMIPKENLEKIMAQDTHPRFQAYIVATEGASSPHVEGIGGKILNWARGIIKSLVQNFQFNKPFYENHNSANYQIDKPEIARLAGWGLKEIAGKLSAVVIAYFLADKKIDAPKYDVISMESKVEMNQISPEEFNVSDVLDISGFALGSSKEWMPAFSDAKLIGSLQFFKGFIKSENIQSENTETITEKKRMTLDEIKKGIRELGLYPNQVFEMDQLAGIVEAKDGKLFFRKGDMIVQKFIKEEVEKLGVIVGHDWKKDADEKLSKIPEYEKSLKQFSQRAVKEKLSAKIKEYSTTAKLEEKQVKYLENQKRLDKFNTEAQDFELEFGKWKDEQLAEYKENFELFTGIKTDGNPPEPGRVETETPESAFLV